ncbi:tyrosine-type recombinase/integrase [Acaryochloris marina]|uniref:tyrosine-type recombinase/integrase n=1 Tax=Acaryochloris marina TaxID=155978 RepID=UPI0021C40D46|nr:site-specific integrase [Acaryochloris marina]
MKWGQPRPRQYGEAQTCFCRDCGRQFTKDRKKPLRLYFNGQLIYSFTQPPGFKYLQGWPCPNCGQEKVLQGRQYYNKLKQKNITEKVCLGCGQKSTIDKKSWDANTKRLLGKEIPIRSWNFEDDKWDLRELYPNFDIDKTDQIFIYFRSCGDDWFKNLLKHYALDFIKQGASSRTLKTIFSHLCMFGRFLQKIKASQMSDVTREVMNIYWGKERSHLSTLTLTTNQTTLRLFLEWGNSEHYFSTCSNLISALFDSPKVFHNEPDPLEDSVLQAIRDNIHYLPEPLQLQFMLGAWLGARPGELCRLKKNCIVQEPDSWWLEFERDKTNDEHKLPLPQDLIRIIVRQQQYIVELFGDDYPYLFCHYQNIGPTGFPHYPKLKPIKRPPMTAARINPMVKAVRHLIEHYDIRDSNDNLAHFTGAILRPTRASELIANDYSLEFVRIWLKHRHQTTTRRSYTRYPPGEMLDVATVMANIDAKLYPYDTNPEALRRNLEDLRQYPDMHELDGLVMTNGEPLYGYCLYREFCPRFGYCYTCPSHVASADKLPAYKAQLARIKANEALAFKYWSGELLESYQKTASALEGIVSTLESGSESYETQG